MDNLQLLIEAMDYIENNLTENIKTDDIANHLYCSKSTIEKLFKYIHHISIRDYIIRRRMSKAAREIARYPEKSLLDIGIQYGYGSNEAFTRAFEGVWQISPSEFRKNPTDYELFPSFKVDRDIMEDLSMSGKKKVDISELYDCFRERRGNYFVVGDIRRLVPINDISFKAGDLAIITAMQRMDNAAGEEDIVFRIGGDEFVILTNSSDAAYAESICKEILSHNGESFVWEGREIPMSMYARTVCFEGSGCFRYSELFTKLQNEISDEYKKICDEQQG